MQHPPDIARASLQEIHDASVLFAEIIRGRPSPFADFME
jgi:hypothetical protein